MIDAHVHIDQYTDDELGSVLAELANRPMLVFGVSMDPASFQRTELIAEISPWVIPTFGIHPWNAAEHVDQLDALDAYIERAPMLGEVGLDQHFEEDPTRYPAQFVMFDYFVAAARDLGKVLNIHTTGAERQVVEALDSEVAALTIVHWYSGPLEEMDELIEMGASFTVGIQLMHSDPIREIARRIPADQLLFETDNPGGEEWLTGTRGMPAKLDEVIEELAAVRGTSAAELINTVQHNEDRFLDSHPALAPRAALTRAR